MFEDSNDPASRIERLRDRLWLAPNDIGTIVALADAHSALGDLPAAIDLYQRALRVDPVTLEALLGLAGCWNRLGEPARARNWLDRAQALDPESEAVRSALAALQADAAPTPVFIRTLFDQYADRFDEELTGTLRYRAPEAVAALLGEAGLPEKEAAILDLGCGTGLSGVALKHFARTLDGVDLSPGMIERARARRIYDRLSVGEADAFLRETESSWDLVAAVDVLNYVGDLTGLFRSAAARLVPSGRLIGTVERAEEGQGLVLTEKRRYAHDRAHLERSAAAADLNIVVCRVEPLRTEAGKPVEGLIFLATPV